MTLFHNKYRVESARLQKWDYSSPGFYFVTLCTYDRICLFGEIVGVEMKMNAYGKIVNEEWLKSFCIRRELKCDEYVVMPNHFHAIVRIMDSDVVCRDVARNVSTRNVSTGPKHKFYSTISPRPNSLSTIIRSFKSAVTKRIHGAGFKDKVWQSRFYDHICRNDRELFAIRQYIANNPVNWKNDRNVIESEDIKPGGKQPWFVYMG
jgi:REP element-mobilizing transposase RayT